MEDGSKGYAAGTVELAERLADALGTLATHPGDAGETSGVGRQLVNVQRALAALGKRT